MSLCLQQNWKIKIKIAILFIIATKCIKYLGINIIIDIQDLCTENYKTMLRQRTKKCRNIPCSQIGGFNVLDMTIIHILICIFNVTIIKTQWVFAKTAKMILQLHGNKKNLENHSNFKQGKQTLPYQLSKLLYIESTQNMYKTGTMEYTRRSGNRP